MTDFRKVLEENRCPAHSDCGAFQMCMCSLVEDAADKIERLRGVLRDLRYPCTCDPAYYERGLVAPDCLADLCGDDAREALGEPLECKGRKAKAAKARAALDGEREG